MPRKLPLKSKRLGSTARIRRYDLEINMKTIGMIGGIGPESTVDYYKEIIAAFHTQYADLASLKLLSIAKRMADEEGIDSLILGCTELPLILTESKYRIPFLNTSAIHCESIITHCIEG